MKNMSLQAQADAILKQAEESGLESNYFFVTTFQRYQTQLEILEALKAEIEETGLTVKKSYVKGKSNVYSSPCVQSFNRTTDSANKTVATLMRILKNFDSSDSREDVDPLMDIINGGDEDDKQ
jgi:hypothetical protein